MMAGLKACGYGWSELTGLQVSQMSETIACVSVGRIRYKTDNKNSNGWARHTGYARTIATGRL
jgi:hypothetical protein